MVHVIGNKRVPLLLLSSLQQKLSEESFRWKTKFKNSPKANLQMYLTVFVPIQCGIYLCIHVKSS